MVSVKGNPLYAAQFLSALKQEVNIYISDIAMRCPSPAKPANHVTTQHGVHRGLPMSGNVSIGATRTRPRVGSGGEEGSLVSISVADE